MLKSTVPIDVSEFKTMSKKKGDLFLLRVIPQLQDPATEQYNLYTNHMLFYYPD